MAIGQAERTRMERAHVAAWPALETASIHGWLWRYSGGGSQRANAVSALDFNGIDVEAAVQEVEARYHARGAPARFHTFEETQPSILPGVLQRRGYRPAESTLTLVRPTGQAGATDAVEIRDTAWPEWLDVYLGVITENRREANRRILNAIPAPRAFFGCRRQGRIVTTALCVISHTCAVIECVATQATDRRSGAARATLHALLAWASNQKPNLIGLQVAASNSQAITLYGSLGFTQAATNRFWVRDQPLPGPGAS